MDGPTGVCAKSVYESLTQQFDWNPEWDDPHEVVVVNTPMSAFFAGPCTWGDLQSTAHSCLLGALAWMSTQADLGSPYTVDGTNQRCYYGANKPRTVQLFEPLLAEVDGTVAGIRTWVMVMDPKLSIREGFRKLITANTEANEEREKMLDRMRTSTSRRNGSPHELAYLKAAGSVSGGLTTAPHRRIMSDLSLVNSVLSMYLGRQQSYANDAGSIDTLYSAGALSCGSPYDPLAVLGDETAFTLHLNGIRPDQCDIENYIDTDEGGDLRSFRGKFPQGVVGHRVLSQYFDSDLLCGSPLPHVMINHIAPIYAKYADLGHEVQQLRAAVEAAVAENDGYRVARLAEDIDQANARRSYLVDAMDDKHEAIRHEAPSASLGSGTLSDAFDSSFVEDTLIQRNAIRKMHRPFTDRYTELRRAFDEAEEKAREEGVAAADDNEVRVEGNTYEEAIQEVRGAMLEQFWRVFNTSERVTPTINAVRRWFGSLRHKQGASAQWTPHFAVAENLTPFGNMIVRTTNDFGDALEVETNFQLMYLTLFVVMGASRYKFGLRPNLVCNFCCDSCL